MRVLILGGCGFIGRHLVKYIVENDIATKIRVADKALPVMTWMSPEFSAVFDNPIVEFKQANLVKDDHVKRAFDDEEGSYDWVINLAAETRYGLDPEVYDSMIVGIVEKCVAEAVTRGCKRWIEVSTAQVYDSGKKPSNETAKLKPWTKSAKAKLTAEEKLKEIEGIETVILRPAIVYGPADVGGIMPRVICAAVYKHMDEKMKFLWSSDTRCNTVHVRDVVRAIVHIARSASTGSVYNIVDKSDTNQGKLASMLGSIFAVRTGFYGSIQSNIAKSVGFKSIVRDANDMHMGPWSELLKKGNINNTPLTPFIDKELLYNNPLSIDASALEESGFEFEVPQITEDTLREQIQHFKDLKLFPEME